MEAGNEQTQIKMPIEMPRYRCHKEVWALRIEEIQAMPGGMRRLVVEKPFAPIEVDPYWVGRHAPCAGGYYVLYKDGYTSYSPAKAFEEGYTRMPES